MITAAAMRTTIVVSMSVSGLPRTPRHSLLMQPSPWFARGNDGNVW